MFIIGLVIDEQIYWIGLRKTNIDDPFVWLDGQQLKVTIFYT